MKFKSKSTGRHEIMKQKAQLNIFSEIFADNFSGGGGASTGIELAIGMPVTIAINHDPDAIAMHKANHPYTEHYEESVWDIDPVEVCRGRKVALAWFSPDCKHFSKAKGGKPVDKNIRGLAWVTLRWAATVKPRVIILENVEEFQTWGPLKADEFGQMYPDPEKKGKTFNSFVRQLKSHGYEVEFKELKACDYGAPTIRKRFFMIARCDGRPIVWPEQTHGPGKIPYRTAADCIDWSLPCPSIFDTKEEIKEKYGINAVRPLAGNTMKRIARGIQKFIIDNPRPFIVPIGYGEREGQKPRLQDIDKPLSTIVSSCKQYLCSPVMTAIGQTGFTEDRSYPVNEPVRTIVSKAEQVVIAPTLIQYHSETKNDEARGQTVDKPILTIDSSPRYGLVSAFISKYYDGNYKGAGSACDEPLHTTTAIDHNSVVTAFINRQFKTSIGHEIDEPLATTTTVNKSNLVKAFLIKYYGSDVGQSLDGPLGTVVSHDRFGLVTIEGVDYQIVDIGLRMLEPKELYAAQGFPADYKIEFDVNGKQYSKAKQVARCGNSVPPPFAEALTRANLPEYCGEKILTMEELEERIAI